MGPCPGSCEGLIATRPSAGGDLRCLRVGTPPRCTWLRECPPRQLALPLLLYFAAPGTAHRRTGAGCFSRSTLKMAGTTACSAQQQSIPDGSGGVLCVAKSRRKAGTAGLGDIRGAEYPGALIGSWPLWADHALGRLLEGLIAARPSAGGELRCPWLVRRRAAPGSANVPRGS
jgi:hypothetical protein